jgi:hypothetical protein
VSTRTIIFIYLAIIVGLFWSYLKATSPADMLRLDPLNWWLWRQVGVSEEDYQELWVRPEGRMGLIAWVIIAILFTLFVFWLKGKPEGYIPFL